MCITRVVFTCMYVNMRLILQAKAAAAATKTQAINKIPCESSTWICRCRCSRGACAFAECAAISCCGSCSCGNRSSWKHSDKLTPSTFVPTGPNTPSPVTRKGRAGGSRILRHCRRGSMPHVKFRQILRSRRRHRLTRGVWGQRLWHVSRKESCQDMPDRTSHWQLVSAKCKSSMRASPLLQGRCREPAARASGAQCARETNTSMPKYETVNTKFEFLGP